MLTVVRPAPAGQGDGAPKRPRSPALSLTDTEQMRLRAALRNLRSLYGTWRCLAEVMGVDHESLRKIAQGRTRASRAMARQAARGAGKTVAQLLGGLAAADRCPTCGRCS